MIFELQIRCYMDKQVYHHMLGSSHVIPYSTFSISIAHPRTPTSLVQLVQQDLDLDPKLCVYIFKIVLPYTVIIVVMYYTDSKC